MEIARDKNNNHMQAVVIDTAYNVEQGQTLKLGEGLYRFAAYEDTTFNMPFLDPNHERPVLAAIYMPAGSVEYFYVYDGTLSVVEGKLNIMGSDIQTNSQPMLVNVGKLMSHTSTKGGGGVKHPFNPSLVDAWFMSGLSNADKPSSIRGIKGNEMALKNFTYSLSSGFGKYEIDFNSWTKNVNAANFTNSDSVIHLTEILVADSKFLQTSVDATISSYQVKVEGITDDIKLRYVSYAEDGTGTYTYLKNGINNLPISYKKFTGFAASVVGSCNITITQLPTAYEGALVFDGVDDYGICNNLPILTDYTVICRRVIENDTNVVASKSIVAGNGAFIFEYANNATYSFSEYTSGLNMNLKDSVSYQTRNSYNGNVITVGTANDTDTLTLGIIREKDSRLLKGAIYYFALYNKSLTPEEIETEKERLNEEWLKRKTE